VISEKHAEKLYFGISEKRQPKNVKTIRYPKSTVFDV
jgi:hypothetical protein